MMEQERIFLLHTMVIDVLELMYVTCGLLWCFISCLDSHSDGTMQKIYILDDLRVSTLPANLNFWVNFSFKSVCYLSYVIIL